MTTIILSPINRSNDAELLKISDRVTGSVKAANALFPNPDPALADIEKSAEEYRLALQAAGTRDKTLIEIKNQKKAVLISQLTRLAAYVSFVSKGDRAVLLASGFEVSTEKGSAAKVPAMQGFTVETKNTGEAILRIEKTAGTKAYMYQYTAMLPTPDTIWVSANGLSRRHIFTQLKSDVRHWFRVVAVGNGGQVVYSEPVSRVIQ